MTIKKALLAPNYKIVEGNGFEHAPQDT